MKLATLRTPKSRDGELIVVDQSLKRACKAAKIAPNLQIVLENWNDFAAQLVKLYDDLNNGSVESFEFDQSAVTSPLPRAYQWLDGSAYLTHVERVRQARGAEMPPSFLNDPLMYQGCSDGFLSPRENIKIYDETWGLDFESEVTVIVDDVPMGVASESALQHIKLIMLVNDISLRNLIPAELGKGFGFLQGKPSSAFSPVAVTPDELGDAWRDGKVHLPLITYLNDDQFGYPDAGADMQFDFSALISHAAKTRNLAAGTIIGSGTVSNADVSKGSSCLAERRVLEIIENGEATTPFMKDGDRVRIEMLNHSGQSIFGLIDQSVELCQT